LQNAAILEHSKVERGREGYALGRADLLDVRREDWRVEVFYNMICD